jgi:hypothetical protein
MQYAEWKKTFVDGGDKNGLKPVVDLKNPPESVIINMGSLEQSLGTVHADKMREILENSPENAREVWNKYADRLQVENAHYKGDAHCSNNGISLDIDEVAQGRTYMGEIAENPYYTAYHEFGHNIDRIAYRERGDYRSLADTFRSSIHLNNSGTGYTLTEMLNAEGKQRVNDVWARLKKEAIAAGGKARDVSKFMAYAEITLELKGKSVISTWDVSDMWDGITKGTIRPHFGHGKAYWKTHTVGVEAFAEMFSATVMNPESVAEIKYYFPKSYEIFEELLSDLR